MNIIPQSQSETKTVSYNLTSGSERTINKLRRTKTANDLDILKHDY